ncbi:hypothetical protein GRX03_09940 [Halovenus sp. WSH3]|uniref:Uncharacterized protein n=1 Tax=Halovenus carboxidivorans TaxID=2692199 RepID=A0A6B0TAL1_9EURY|nr:hypothetical protein [Halovenus carboxidivorans]MXR51920.1 hypothetical protein [Halovenus carboxidivorans]
MTAQNHPDTAMSGTTARRWTARVTVRVPRDGGADLASDATRRLESVDRINTVSIDGVCGLEPALAATAVGLELTVEMRAVSAAETVESALDTAPGTERVERVAPIDE